MKKKMWLLAFYLCLGQVNSYIYTMDNSGHKDSVIEGKKTSGSRPPNKRRRQMIRPTAPASLDTMRENRDCPICLENMQPEITIQLQCHVNHLVCRDCLIQQLKRDWRCPICRANIPETWIHNVFGKESFLQIKKALDDHLTEVIHERIHQDEQVARRLNQRQINPEALVNLFLTAMRNRNIPLMTHIIHIAPHIKNIRSSSDGASLLHRAAIDNATDAITLLLEAGASVDLRDNNRITPLHFACLKGNLESAGVLLEYGADVQAQTNKDATALHFAATNNNTDLIEVLLRAGARINATESENLTPLHIATMYDHVNVIKTLLEAGAAINSIDGRGLTPLHIATGFSHLDAIKIFLEFGANPFIVTENNQSTCPFYIAIKGGEVTVLRAFVAQIIKHTCSKNITDQKDYLGRTPVHIAAISGRPGVFKALIEAAEFDLDALDSQGYAPLHLASLYGQEHIVRLLLEHKKIKIDIEAGPAGDNPGCTPLHVAAAHGHTKIIHILIDHGANIRAREQRNGATPLHIAAAHNQTKVIKLLQEAGVDVNIKDTKMSTALHVAAAQGGGDSIKELLQAGADINARDHRGFTPLHMAAAHGQVESLRVLVAGNANTKALDNKNFTPLDIARKYQRQTIVDILEEMNIQTKQLKSI